MKALRGEWVSQKTRTTTGASKSAARTIRVTSEPQDHLAGQEVASADAATVARVVLERRLQEQVAQDRVAGADLYPGHRRVPGKRPGGGLQVTEAQMIR